MTTIQVAVCLLLSQAPDGGSTQPVHQGLVAGTAEQFASKVLLLDSVDDAVLRGDASSIPLSSSVRDQCPQATAERWLKLTDPLPADCAIAAGEKVTRIAINLGTRVELVDSGCGLSRVESSELFYRVDGYSLKVTVIMVALKNRVLLARTHCRRSQKRVEAPTLTNCSGRWPLVTQTTPFSQCPWSQP